MDVTMIKGGQVSKQDFDASFLGDKVKHRLLHESVVMYAANKRQGTSKVKHRSEIALSTRQLFKQKGTGRARVRHRQVVSCRGGGRAHGPHPRDWGYQIPKKARRIALANALLSKFRDGEVVIHEDFRIEAPKTKVVAALLKTAGIDGTCLIVSAAPDKNLYLSARNVPKVSVTHVGGLNAYDVIFHSRLVLTEGAMGKIQEMTSRG